MDAMDAVKFLSSRLRTCDSYPGCNGCEWKGKSCPGYVTYNPIFATQDERVKSKENVVKKERAEKEMDAVKFIEERSRMCKSFDKCSFGCPAWDGSCKLETGTYLECEADKQVEIVKEWSAAHPRKTRQSVFLEQWPNCMIDNDGVVGICPRNIDNKCICDLERFHDFLGCSACRRKFWRREVE